MRGPGAGPWPCPDLISRRQALRRLGGGMAIAALAPLAPRRLGAQPLEPEPQLTGRVVRPADPDYNAARQDFNKVIDVFPREIVYCQNSADVVNAIAWAQARRQPIAVRSGGHSYEGFSLGPGLVVDLSEMNAIQVDAPRGIAVAQPGIRLMDFYQALAADGVTVPAGTCGSVGLAGLTLGGGIGFLSRKWGLTCDNLIGLEMVDANGRLLAADQARNPDLLWACCGGGGSFGVVTSFTFEVHPIGDVVVFNLEWPLAAAASVLASWQRLAPFWPDDLTATTEIHGTPAGKVTCEGMFVGDQSGLLALLEPVLTVALPSQVAARTMPFLDAARHFDDGGAPPYHKAKSDYALAPLSREAIATLLAALVASPSADDLLQFQPYGGAIDRVPTSATAFPHRAGTLFSMQYLAYWSDPAAAPPSQRWIAEFYTAMRPYVSGYAYSNNCDVDILDWQRAYYGANFERLVEVKTKYDPRDVFHFAQSIPPST